MTGLGDEIDAEARRRMMREFAIYNTLSESLPMITRVVMSIDLRSAEDALALVHGGSLEPEKALEYSGSYARIAMLCTLVDEGLIETDRALDLLPTIWPAADPDDTDPRLWAMWQAAFDRNGGIVTDGPSLPSKAYFTITG